MKFKKTKRLLSFVLIAFTLAGQSADALLGGFTYSYPIGIGTTYLRNEGYNESGLQKASIITYTPNDSVSPIGVRSGDQFYGNRKTISQAAASLESQGYDVIGGINADFFSFSDGVPTGLFVDNGRLIASTDWQAAVGFMEDGSVIMGDPITDIVVSGESGKIAVFDYNKTRTTRGLVLLDRYYSDTTHFGSAGKSIIMEYDDFSTLKIGEPITLTVVDKISGSDSFAIGENQMVLSRRDDCTTMPWIDFQIGEKITITFGTSDPRWSDVKYAVGGKTLLTNGTVTTSGIDSGSSNVARSAIGVKSDGTVVLYEVDGGNSNYSRGLTAKQLASELQQLGCVSALALDGGGSSAMTVKNPMNDTTKTVTFPSDGSERACSTYIFFVNNVASDGIPSAIHIEPSTHYLLPGSTVSFQTVALDDSFSKTNLPDDIVYTTDSGTVTSTRYTAPLDMGTVTVSASSPSTGASGSMQLSITEPTSLTLLKDGKSVSSLSLKSGEKVQINAVPYRNGQIIAASNEQIVWSVTGDIGTITKSGEFTATKSGTGKITASSYGITQTVNVTVDMGNAQNIKIVADFEDSQPFIHNNISLVTNPDDVCKGYGAAKIQYDDSSAYIAFPSEPVSEFSSLTLWAKLNETTGNLSAIFTDESGNEITVPFDSMVTSNYTQLKVNIPNNAVYLKGIALENTTSGGVLYLDHVLLSEFAVTNTDAPKITISSQNTSVAVGESASVTFKVTQDSDTYPLRSNNVIVYVDGKVSDAKYAPSSASITVNTGSLNAGTHIISIEAEDDAGNRSRKVITFSVGKRTDSKFSDVSNSWALGYINLLSDRGIMNGEKLSNGTWVYNPASNLKRSEFAVLMANVLELDTNSEVDLPFDDAESIPSWAASAISAVTKAGIMSGQIDNKTGSINFNPSAEITRSEVMSVIYRCLPQGYTVKNVNFTDAESIPSWAKNAVNYVTSVGIINGYTDGTIKPTNKITRAEIASVICNFR